MSIIKYDADLQTKGDPKYVPKVALNDDSNPFKIGNL